AGRDPEPARPAAAARPGRVDPARGAGVGDPGNEVGPDGGSSTAAERVGRGALTRPARARSGSRRGPPTRPARARRGQNGRMRPLRFFGVAADGPVDARQLVATARTAESAGFAGLVLTDHLLAQHAPIPVLATIAAVTERLRIAPFVLNAGLRHPAGV